MATAYHTLVASAKSVRTLRQMDDLELLPLLEEAETFSELTPLEQELTIRLGAAWETMQRMDAQAMSQGLALD